MFPKILVRNGVDRWHRFAEPIQILTTRKISQVLPILRQIEKTVQNSDLYAVGFVSYEAATAFDLDLETKQPSDFPLIWFAICPPPKIEKDLKSEIKNQKSKIEWCSSISRENYDLAIKKIKNYIADGDTYQVNFTFQRSAPFYSDPLQFFQQIENSQNSPHSAFIETDRFAICSASPELFFEKRGDLIITRPMKGTIARGLTLDDDLERSEWLRSSEKNRAENLMIVDMLRNDLGKIAEIGSVAVPKLFEIEKYHTVWQMTSTVSARSSASISEIFKALFPCASITGAPKRRTMQIITNVEKDPRKIYCGTIGFFNKNNAKFSVAIRTVLIDKMQKIAEYGAGGGIIWDSIADQEFNECEIKSKILTETQPNFSLFETLLWENRDYFLIEYHIDRLRNSAIYFDFRFDENHIRDKLDHVSNNFEIPNRVRLTLDRDGETTIEAFPFVPSESVVKVRIAKKPIDPSDRSLYHKTTHRKIYENVKIDLPNCDDVILWNRNGEITESCIANVVIRKGDQLLTPPISCGLLGGTFRKFLIDRKTIKEKILKIEDLKSADEIWLINSVRKWRRAGIGD